MFMLWWLCSEHAILKMFALNEYLIEWWHGDTVKLKQIQWYISFEVFQMQMIWVNIYMMKISCAHIIMVFNIWCHCMYQCHPHGGLTTKETQIYPLLVLCGRNPPVRRGFPSQRQLCRKDFHVTTSSCIVSPQHRQQSTVSPYFTYPSPYLTPIPWACYCYTLGNEAPWEYALCY